MKSTKSTILTFLLQVSSIHAKQYLKNVSTFQVGPDVKIIANSIEYSEPDCEPGLRCTTTKTCAAPGTVPTLSQDRRHFACCTGQQHLLGSPETAFDCCAVGHDLVGSAATGYYCCPTGWSFDGRLCRPVSQTSSCHNGQPLVDGKCGCPSDQVQAADGSCQNVNNAPAIGPTCSSGLVTGKCYIFTGANGRTLGSGADGIYYAHLDDMNFHYGKFQLCADATCTPNKPINPGDLTYIRDLYGDPKTGANGGQWLNNAKDGGHIGKTKDIATAGKFSLSRWPCGKYCLGGVQEGIGPACPADTPAITFFSGDPQMCVPFELTEVPCDIKAAENNCIWRSQKNECCGGKVDCTLL